MRQESKNENPIFRKMKFQKKYILLIAIAILCLVVYSSSLISPETSWFASLLAFAIPLVFVFQCITGLVLFIYKTPIWTRLFWLVCMLPFLYFLPHMIGFSKQKEVNEDFFTVANYNVGHFNNRKSTKSVKEMDASDDVNANLEFILQLKNLTANVVCFQEFYQCEQSNYYNVGKILKEKYPYQMFAVDTITNNGSVQGLAIFSQFPIKQTGNIFESKNHFNRGSFADIAIGDHMIRVINVHLQSNQIKHFNPIHDHTVTKAEKDALTVFYHLKNNLLLRANQAEQVLDFAKSSPYPAIVAGDFNETSYGYIYNNFRHQMNNAFAKSGNGFGITYQGKTLSFLRIDQQFYNDQLNCESFSVEKDFLHSDHLPIQGVYSLNIIE